MTIEIGPRTIVREGIQSSHSYTVTERVIGGTRYHFLRHYSLSAGPEDERYSGIRVWIPGADGTGVTREVLEFGQPMPELGSGWRKPAVQQEREDIARAKALGFKLMTSKYPGTCKGCGKPIAVGARIWYAKGNTRHEGCSQPAQAARRGSSRYGYTISGARLTNRYARCEDAPCCGCCN